jgi:hypothetical protein
VLPIPGSVHIHRRIFTQTVQIAACKTSELIVTESARDGAARSWSPRWEARAERAPQSSPSGNYKFGWLRGLPKYLKYKKF